jgi:hypothetical protein
MAVANWQSSKVEYWKNLPPPARPWPSEIAWFEKYTVDKKSKEQFDVLILGATVEFRSVCHKHGVNVHVVDFSKNFFDILSEQHMDFRGHETFYEQDWRNMDLGKKFDLILGDLVANVLHPNDYDLLFRRVLEHLKSEGLFINRYWARPDASHINLDAVAERHYQLYADRYPFYQTSMQYVYPYHAESLESIWNIAEAKAALDNIHSRGLLKDADYDFFVKALAVEKNPGSTMVKEDFEAKVKRLFNINAIHYGKDPGHEWFPIYICSKLVY